MLTLYVGSWLRKHFLFGQCIFFNTSVHSSICKPHPHPLTQSLHQKNICSCLLPHGAASEPITANVTQQERGCVSFPTPTCRIASLVSVPAFTCICPGIPKASQLFLSDPHPSPTSCTHSTLALDHCVLIAALAGYTVGQTAKWGWAGSWGRACSVSQSK